MQSFSQVSAVLMAAEGHLESGVVPGSEAALRHAWKTQHACVPFLLPARICQCLPLSKLHAVPKQTRFRPQNSKKASSTHTKDKLRISRTQSLLIALVSRFCTTYFPPWPNGENQVWRSTLALAALRRSHCCCFGHHVAELGHCEQRKRPMHAKWKKKDGKTLYWTTLPAVWSSQPCCWFAGKVAPMFAVNIGISCEERTCAAPAPTHDRKTPSRLDSKPIPDRIYPIFDEIGSRTTAYRPGTRWCYHCTTRANKQFSSHPEFILLANHEKSQSRSVSLSNLLCLILEPFANH